MSRKVVFRILVIAIILLVLGITAFCVDVAQVLNGQKPKFCFKTNVYDDGGTKEYIGLGYKIFKYNTLTGNNSVKFGTLLLKYSDNQDLDEVNKNVNMIGKIVSITKSNDRYVLYVESDDKTSQYDKAYVSVVKDTQVKKSDVAVKHDIMKVGDTVKIVFTGIILESYPPQATARVVYIVK